ncbi:GDP-6-deoxy-D-mannose reductase [Hartmannibacter diazotrophicus]|uniref:GDP-6-deoxy-D-mannose reductase n=1 Tax=Hartmannibacter diazotrophicus TaxID=1482074 RepID=A0A2C9DE77_9HYPH|nr:D-erythronate dehydrogenase [Hartmannibacter diazotrophicus]SON58015.1 GDP-6-deoxy-D-mannose reductase [Hartmannibacter diazotrophicus]
MDVLVIGAAGMVGRKLVEHIAAHPDCLGGDIRSLHLVDIVAPSAPAALSSIADCAAVDLSTAGTAEKLISRRPDLVFHLAAIVSGEAEADFDKGYRVNLDGSRDLFDAIRAEGQREPYRPRVVFASSIAVFGAPFPETIPDEFLTAPLTSYGAQKAITELLLADYSRRGVFDGIGIRLPTVCVRPGSPNKAASGFFSNILREPLVGIEAVLPVSEDVRHWFASPRSAVGFFVHGATLDLDRVGPRRNLTMPGLSATVGEEIAALQRVAGTKATSLIRREPDPVIMGIVAGWPTAFDASRAASLGFTAETSFDEIIRAHVEDELAGVI